ncbi:putative colanic acid biosynthesis acetyltransferase [Mesonia sp.]|uniref:putative colanic acid biosynthesis acetyltransferase n=1 Tax=Mesonia sp. TaxID=1960830 RepID=UPI0025C18749|nr:putative colanic acid biosynthesis acetyltransferase [Mesonia sp.]
MNIQNLNTYKTPPGFRGRSKITVQLWWLVQATLFKLSPQFMYAWRRFLLRIFDAKIGKNVIIRPSVKITYPWKLSIGDYAWVGDDVVLYTLGEIEIGAHAVISQKSYLCTGSHDYKSESFEIYAQKISIEKKCWLATDVYVAPGVTIGEGSVIGARSSVFKNVPKQKIGFGSPFKIIKNRI